MSDNIIEAKFAETVETVEFTSSGQTVIDKFTATNNTAFSVDLTCHLPNPSEAFGSSNVIVRSVTIPAWESYLCPELVLHVLENKGTIVVKASTGNAVIIRSSGRSV